MKIFIKARPGAGAEKVEKIDDVHFTVWVREPAQKGLANQGVIRALAEYFNKPKSLITIKSGHTASVKVIEIL